MTESSELERPLLIGVKEVSRLLDLNADRVYELIRAGELPSVPIASSAAVPARKLRVPYAAVEAYVDRIIEQERHRPSATST